MPSRNGDTHPAVQDAIRLMRRARSVPESVRRRLAEEQRRRAVERIIRLRRSRGEDPPRGD